MMQNDFHFKSFPIPSRCLAKAFIPVADEADYLGVV